MNAKISVFVICVETIIYLLLICMTVPLNHLINTILERKHLSQPANEQLLKVH